MKRWEFSGSWKALAVILNQICAVVLVLSMAICSFVLGNGGLRWLREDDSFERTESYRNEVEEQIYRCVQAVSRESKFEKNGVYDTRLILDIREYVEDNKIIHTDAVDGGLYYKLTDLLSWFLDGYDTHTLMKITYTDGTVGYVSKSSMNYTEQSLYKDGDAVASTSSFYNFEEFYDENGQVEPGLKESTTKTDTETGPGEEDTGGDLGAPGQASIQNVEQVSALDERFTPVEYSSVVDYAEEHQLSTSELQDIYYILESALSMIYNDFYSYKDNLELLSPDMTNMRYMVIPKDVVRVTKENYEQKIYTNIKNFGDIEIRSQESLLDYIRAHRDFLIFDSSNMSFEENNMPVSLSDISTYLKGYPISVDGDYILAIAVDPKYMASDTLQEYKKQYDEIRPLSRAALYGAVLGALLYLLTLVYLTMAAGRGTDGEDKTIRLNSFDKLKTEAVFVISGVPAVLVVFITTWAYSRFIGATDLNFSSKYMIGYLFKQAGFTGLTGLGAYAGGITFILNLLFLIVYLSMVRRVKSGTLWQNSVLCSVTASLSSMFQRRKVTTKAILTYLLFLGGNIILLCCGVFGGFLAFALDLMAGFLVFRQARQRQQILDGIERISEGNLTHQILLDSLSGDSLVFAKAVNNIGEGLSTAVEQSIKDERLKTDLITNVSHDIKTPLTSIINYVDLLKREDIQNERARNYIAILEDKAQRLKYLTDDLVEASKISSGNVKLEFVRINFQELVNQTNGEFCERFEEKGLQLVVNMPKSPVIIEADGRRLWRIIENLYTNVAKYAMPHTRVYVELTVVGHMVRFNVKNISEQPLNIDAKELTERFIRGDIARSTEGSGLGLSIAKNLTELQKGSFDIYLDGDLFKVTIIFPEAPPKETKEEKEETKELLEDPTEPPSC